MAYKTVTDTDPKEIINFPEGDLTILVGQIKAGKTGWACQAALSELKRNPYSKVAVMSNEYTMSELRSRLESLLGTDRDPKELNHIIYLPGPFRCSRIHEEGKPRSYRDLEYMEMADVIIYDTCYKNPQDPELNEFLKLFPKKKHIAIFQTDRSGNLREGM